MWGTHAGDHTGPFGGAPYGITKRVGGVPQWARGRHANPGTGAIGGAPDGATKRVRGVPKGGGGAMRVPPLGPSVELPMGSRNDALGAGDACEFRHWDLRWISLWGHETMHWAQETHASSAGDDPFATGA